MTDTGRYNKPNRILSPVNQSPESFRLTTDSPANLRRETFLKAFNFNAVGITDAMFVAASPSKVKEFQYGPFAVEVRNGAAWLKEKKNTLCGSCVTMDIIFENLLNIIAKNQPGYISGKLFDKPVSLDSAVSMASRLVSENPAKLYGFEGRLGSIEDGKAADLVIAVALWT